MKPSESPLGDRLDLSFIRVAGWLDDGRIRHRALAGRLALTARFAEVVIAQDGKGTSEFPVVASDANLTSAQDSVVSPANWRDQYEAGSGEAAAALDAISIALQRQGVWQSEPTMVDKLLRRRRFVDTKPDEVRSEFALLASGRRANDGWTAVLQELVHSYSPSSTTLTWWTTDPNFPIKVPAISATQTFQLATLFEAARAVGPRYAPNAAGAAEAGWRPTLSG